MFWEASFGRNKPRSRRQLGGGLGKKGDAGIHRWKIRGHVLAPGWLSHWKEPNCFQLIECKKLLRSLLKPYLMSLFFSTAMGPDVPAKFLPQPTTTSVESAWHTTPRLQVSCPCPTAGPIPGNQPPNTSGPGRHAQCGRGSRFSRGEIHFFYFNVYVSINDLLNFLFKCNINTDKISVQVTNITA